MSRLQQCPLCKKHVHRTLLHGHVEACLGDPTGGEIAQVAPSAAQGKEIVPGAPRTLSQFTGWDYEARPADRPPSLQSLIDAEEESEERSAWCPACRLCVCARVSPRFAPCCYSAGHWRIHPTVQ